MQDIPSFDRLFQFYSKYLRKYLKKYGEKFPEISKLAYTKQQETSTKIENDNVDINDMMQQLQHLRQNLETTIEDVEKQQKDLVSESSDQRDELLTNIVADMMVKLFVDLDHESSGAQYFRTNARIIEKLSQHKVFAGLAYLAAAYLSVIQNGKSTSKHIDRGLNILHRTSTGKQLVLAYSTHLVFHHQHQKGLKFLELVLNKFEEKGLKSRAKQRYFLLNIYLSQFKGDDIGKQLWLDKYGEFSPS